MGRKLISIGLLVGATVLVAVSAGSSNAAAASHAKGRKTKRFAGETLTVSTWGGAWTDAFKKYFAVPFSKKTGAKFQYVVSGSDPDAPVLLQEQANNVHIDLVDSGLGSELVIHHDLARLPKGLRRDLAKTSLPGTVSPYWWTYGTVIKLLVCNTQLVAKCPTSLQQFWDVKNYPGTRMVDGSPQEAIVGALLAANVAHKAIEGHPNLGIAENMLRAIKPSVTVWAQSGDQQVQTMASGQAAIGYMWESRAVSLISQGHPNLKLYWNGANTQSDFAFLVPKHAPHEALAFDFLKWVAGHLKNQAGFSKTLGTFVPGKVMKYIPKSQRKYQAQKHAKQIFYWSSFWYSKHAKAVQSAWQSVIG